MELERRLEVGLLERREDAAGVRHLELRVEVDAAVDRVDEAVQALAGAGVGAGRVDGELVLLGESGQRDAAVGVRGGVDRRAVERDRGDLSVDEIDERRRSGGRPERDRRGRSEAGLGVEGEVELDVVRLGGDD